MAFELILSSLYCQWAYKETKEDRWEILIELELKYINWGGMLVFSEVSPSCWGLAREPRVLELAGNRKSTETLIKA